MDFTIDPKAHRQQQRAQKIRTLAQKGSTEGERKAAERKTKGPKMFGEMRLSYYGSKEEREDKEHDKRDKERKLRMKHGKRWKEFTRDAESAKNRLRPGEVRTYDKKLGKWVSNKD